MPSDPPPGQAQITSYLVYDDPAAAIDWLEQAFGLETRARFEDDAGNIVHCELAYGHGVIGIGGPTAEARSPRAIDGRYTQSLYCYVDDVDAHFARATAAGATVVRPLTDQEFGDRVYGCLDLEGHPWFFGTRVDQAAWEAVMASADT